MWKKIGLVVLCLLIGCVLGSILSMAYLGRSISKGMFMLQEEEIFKIGEAAEEAYYNQPNEVAVWALENYVDTLNELKKERNPAGVKDCYFLLSPDTDLVFAHSRLGKLYEQMGNAEKSSYHFEQAIACSKNTPLKSINTKENCLRMLDRLDKARSK